MHQLFDASHNTSSSTQPAQSRWLFIAGIRVEIRTAILGLLLVVVMLVAGITGLLLGDYPMTTTEALGYLIGVGNDPLGVFFVQHQRLPRVLAAAAIGASLGIAGTIFQQLSRNALGSPDLIGFTTGAATGAVAAIILGNAGPFQTAIGAIIGGAVTAVIVYALALQNHKLSALRLILVGIGVAAFLQAVNGLLIVKASLSAAQTAALWLAGSFNAMTWSKLLVALLLQAMLVPIALALARPLSLLTLGDDLATGLGLRVERRRAQLIAVGVALTALAVAVAGPIAFVALAAPQLARKLSMTSGVGMATAALMGSVLVLVSDIIAQRMFAPVQLPVGVVTGLLGGMYLLGLLAFQWRR
ncbi:iron chelate uptake ABC transporter family permease subunit [Corynebacterium sp. HS2168-gen11]|uniref:FecCD family ABC transporter permease n=1 Tax=Corynebacterium sp. HS2168-gen11 TaxID=2974027 RepID=UPI00216B02AC|nr:iron chelate uptake ABC transporter family permease subunit [Corynebacterium sp. HS2168-gen11]MCS4535687.1 iron chelate uptake ABC transporter family permease subunit [Corynebacterium sp. HS2168-gen11]